MLLLWLLVPPLPLLVCMSLFILPLLLPPPPLLLLLLPPPLLLLLLLLFARKVHCVRADLDTMGQCGGKQQGARAPGGL